jgi:hypothetical protein
MNPNGDRPAAQILVVTIHGIRTFGEWQDRLAAALAEESRIRGLNPPISLSYRFGYFSALALAVPLLRRAEVSRFRGWLERILLDYPEHSVRIVAHSFGTFVTAHTLLKLQPDLLKRVDTLVFAGSILQPGFQWQKLVGADRVKLVLNDCGTRDSILVLAQMFILGGGIGGRVGFAGIYDGSGRGVLNRYFRYSHSDYFLDRGPSSHMTLNWVPVLLGDRPQSNDDRERGIWAGIRTTVIQNLAASKALVYLGLLAALAAAIYVPQYRQSQKTLAETRARLAETNARLAEAHFEMGRQRLLASQPGEASAALHQALTADPKHFGASFLQPIVDRELRRIAELPLTNSHVSGDARFQIGFDPIEDLAFSEEPAKVELRTTRLSTERDIGEMKAALVACEATPVHERKAFLSYSGGAAVIPEGKLLCDLSRKKAYRFDSMDSNLIALARSADVVAIVDGTRLAVWSESGESLKLDRKLKRAPVAVALDAEGHWVAAGFADGKVFLHSISHGMELEIKARAMAAMQLTATQTGLRLLTCKMTASPLPEESGDYFGATPSYAELSTVCPIENRADRFEGIEHPVGKLELALWDIVGTQAKLLHAKAIERATGALMLERGKYLLTASGAGLSLYRADGRLVATLSKNSVADVSVSADGQRLAYRDTEGATVLLLASGRPIAMKPNVPGGRLRLTSDGAYLVAWEGACTNNQRCWMNYGSIETLALPIAKSFRVADLQCGKVGPVDELRAVACGFAGEYLVKSVVDNNEEKLARVYLDRFTAREFAIRILEGATPRFVKRKIGMSVEEVERINNARTKVEFVRRSDGRTVSEIELLGYVDSVAAAPNGQTFAVAGCVLSEFGICDFRLSTWNAGEEAKVRSQRLGVSAMENATASRMTFESGSARLVRIDFSAGSQLGGTSLVRYSVDGNNRPDDNVPLMENVDNDIIRDDFGFWVSDDRKVLVTAAQQQERQGEEAYAVYDLETLARRHILEASIQRYSDLAGQASNRIFMGIDAAGGFTIWELQTGKLFHSIPGTQYNLVDLYEELPLADSDEAGREGFDLEEATTERPLFEVPCANRSGGGVRGHVHEEKPIFAVRCGGIVDVVDLSK